MKLLPQRSSQGRRHLGYTIWGVCAVIHRAKGLVTGGGLQSGWHVKYYPYEKGGRKSFSHAEGGAQKNWGSFYAVAWSCSHIEGGGARKKFPLFKRGGGCEKLYPVINYQSLMVISLHFLSTRNVVVSAEKKQSAHDACRHGDVAVATGVAVATLWRRCDDAVTSLWRQSNQQAQPGLTVNGDFTSSIWSWFSINEGVYFSNPCIIMDIFARNWQRKIKWIYVSSFYVKHSMFDAKIGYLML